MKGYYKSLKVIFSVMLFIFLASFVIAQNSRIETRSERKAEIRNMRFLRFQEFNTSIEDEHMSPFRRKRRIPDSYSDIHKTLKRNNICQSTADSINQAWVEHYGPEAEPVSDRAFDLAVDKSGNIYITGSSDNDFITIKYNASGSQQWIKYYTSPAEYSGDIATSIVLDDTDNIYVSGYCYGFSSYYGYDYVTIKYDSAGDEQWIAGYAANRAFDVYYDKIFMAVDDSGNVYLAGTNNRVIIKYNAAGLEQWVKHVSKKMYVIDMTIDHAGYVYVVGNMWDETSDIIVTAKYNSAGEELWIAEDKDIYFEHSNDITVDDSGNVYVAGFGMFNSNINYIILKYDSSGIEQWTIDYNGQGNSSDYANDAALDQSGNLYVTGQSGNGCATVKYNSAGMEQWVARYDRTNLTSAGERIALDRHGNVFVSGYSYPSDDMSLLDYLTIRYNAAGEEQWVNVYSQQDSSYDLAMAMSLDESGALYITGMSNDLHSSAHYYDYNCATIKYDASGNEQWIALYDGPKHAYAGAEAIAVDKDGYIYVTGGAAEYGFATFKYSSTGEEIWAAFYYDGWAADMAVDQFGNVYVTGAGTIAGSNKLNYITIKYNLEGSEQWVANYHGPLNAYDVPVELALDHWGNIYVTGLSNGSNDHGQSIEYATVKYNPLGIEQWAARYTGPDYNSDAVSAIAVDDLGNAYVTGASWNKDRCKECATIKYNTFGEQEWVVRYSGPGNIPAEGTDIAVDTVGNIYVTGSNENQESGLDFITIKYDISGAEKWIARYNGSANQDDEANAIGLDEFGNIYVTGYCNGSDTVSEFVTIKYNPAGEEQWAARYSGEGNGRNEAIALTFDLSGNIYVTGNSRDTRSLSDISTLKYDSAGNLKWMARFDGVELPDDYASAIAVDAIEQVYVAGYSGSAKSRNGYATHIGIGNRDSKYTVIKYSNELVSVEVKNSDVPLCFRLEQNYPNPFNSTTRINYQIHMMCNVCIKVHDLLGREVATIFKGVRPAGNYSMNFDASELAGGVYFYRMQAENFVETKKFILLK